MKNTTTIFASLALAALASSPLNAQQQSSSGQQTSGEVAGKNGLSVSLPDGLSAADLGKRDLEILAVQVMLDRTRHSPGVIDGYMGGNTRRAIAAYRRSNGLPSGDSVDSELLRSLLENQSGDVFRTYSITQDDVNGPFTDVPSSFEAMAELDRVGYESAQEMLAERFHMDSNFLAALNPGVDFSQAGQQINIIAHGDDELGANVARIEVRKSQAAVVALDGQGNIVASYPTTVGSSEFPSPNGTMEVAAVAPEANYTFKPSGREWGPDEVVVIPPGPNNPVGGIWIDLTKDGYGIHGSPDPQLIGKTASHGCVRLTNWDASELAGAVSQGIPVEFV